MPDTKLSGLIQGTVCEQIYGLESGNSRKFHSALPLNVRNFGAVGDGVTDDTVAIQNCFDAAWGSVTAPHGPHGGTGTSDLNRPVYIPNGNYKVSSPTPLTITNISGASGGDLTVTVASTTGWLTNWLVYIAGVVGTTGNFATTLNGVVWGIQVLSSTQLLLRNHNGIAWTGAYASGGTVRTGALHIAAVHGGKLTGAGKVATIITNATANCTVLSINGWGYGLIEDINFSASGDGSGTCYSLDLNWDGITTQSTQSNTIRNCTIGGTPDYSLGIGNALAMCSETLIIDCKIAGAAIAGIYNANANALNNTVFGGNISGCAIGVWVEAGQMNFYSVGFQTNSTKDIYVTNSAGASTTVSGCRSESVNFVDMPVGYCLVVSGCSQSNGGDGFFVNGGARTTITSCRSSNGWIAIDGGYCIIQNSRFERSDYLTAGSENFAYLEVHPQVVTTQIGATYSFISADCSSKVLFNRATAQTATVGKTSDNTLPLVAGSKIDIQQIGAGQVTIAAASGVTIRSSNGLKLRAQYSVATLTNDASDTWTLSGDTSV